MQAGGCDCGLFAIAFATALALGKHPGQYLFDQGKMRRHLWNCFRKKRIEMFPFTKLRRATPQCGQKKNSKCIVFVGCLNWQTLPGTGSSALAVKTGTTQIHVLQYLLLHCKIKLLGFAVTVFKLDSV